jgi:IS605 OrfB family transposase
VEQRVEAAHPRVVHGGGRVWRNRQHLEEAGLTAASWRERWDASRWFLTADGETGKKCGNETIRVDPDGHVTIKIPAALVEKFGSHLQLSVPLNLDTHRAAEWRDRIATNRAVGYRIVFDPAKGRWYLHASWTYPKTEPTPLSALQAARTLAVDVNGDHLAGWVVDPSGNPVAQPITIPLTVAGPTTLRDASLRHGITRLLQTAQRRGCESITIENLNFAHARRTGRETTGRGERGKRFRRTVAGIPTGQFRNRLVAMATQTGIAVVAVDPAYTSRWGAEHWLKPLTQRHQKTSDPAVTRHHAAAVVIGRRAHRLPARRRAVRTRHVTEDTHRPNSTPRTTSTPPNRRHVTGGIPLPHPKAPSPTGRADSRMGTAVQHRAGPPARDSPPLSS